MVGLALRSSKNLKSVIVLNPDNKVYDILKDFFEPHFLSNRVEFLPLQFEDMIQVLSFDLTTQSGMDAALKLLSDRSKSEN